MSNDYYNHGSTPVQRSTLSSALIRAEFDSISAGFNKLPTLTGNAYKLVVVNAASDALSVASWGVYGGGNASSNTAYGLNALSANVAGTSNTAIGSQTLTNATVSHNTGVGCQVMTAAVGADNTAVGAFAYNALTGSKNTALGYNVGTNRTTGTDNVEIGYNAVGNATATGSDNVVIGSNAGANFTSANKNTLVGRTAGQAIATGAGNSAFGYLAALSYTADGIVAFGYQALTACTTGLANTAIGYNAMASCIDGGFNTAIGQSALFSVTSGTLNTGVGQGALVDVDGGGSNTSVGAGSGINIVSGNQNTYLGYHAYPSGNYSNSMGLGYNARPTASNQVVVGDANITETVLRGQVKGGAGTGTGQPVMVGTLSVNTTPVGNVGAGTDDLMTYELPANSLSANNKGARITAWGSTANNANAKTLTLLFGSTTIFGGALTISQAGLWKIVVEIFRTGSNAQIFMASVLNTNSSGAILGILNLQGSPTETDSVAITIKCTGAATADNDIVQKGMMIEFIN